MSNPVTIQTEESSKPYGQLRALLSLTLEVRNHSIFGFLGPNGAGKTTAIKLLLGLAGRTSGTASVFGLDIGRDSAEIREREGYLAQDPRYYGHMTAREMPRFTARFFYAGPNSAIEDRIRETLELVGPDEMANRPIEERLAGTGEVVYTLTLQGDKAAAQGRLVAQPWVRSITADPDHGATVLKVTVTDELRASPQLLSVVLGDPSEVGAAYFDVVESGREEGLAMNVTLSFEHDMIGFTRKTFWQRKETMT
jgi:ABC-type hemin transport system ATPase subunit